MAAGMMGIRAFDLPLLNFFFPFCGMDKQMTHSWNEVFRLLRVVLRQKLAFEKLGASSPFI